MRAFNFTPPPDRDHCLDTRGKNYKKIAQLLAISKDTVDMQRLLIRKRLGLTRKTTFNPTFNL
jgi:hypothetical protein